MANLRHQLVEIIILKTKYLVSPLCWSDGYYCIIFLVGDCLRLYKETLFLQSIRSVRRSLL
jgi:hypothetical protein